ncbi:kinesin-like protein KIF18A isoform X2 [Oculina patagonica]
MVETSDKGLSRRRSSSARRSQANGGKDKNSNMKVVVRVRPANDMEIVKQSSTSVRVMDERMLVFDPKDDSLDYLSGNRRRKQPQFLTRRARDLRFMFDRVFDHESSNRDVFEHTTKTIVDGVLGGYNCTVFAYGATGAGKTFTMLGDQSNPGVMFLTMMELYSRINACKDEKISDVAVSYLEVYNETIRDLLMPGQPLAVREDPQRGVCVSGLTLHKPTSAEELLGMLEFGNNNRTQHPTDANAQSSRSHAVFQVFVRQKDRTAGLQTNFTMGKMSLIDLAGSERAIVTSNRGARFREGANINKSLLALGNCINALADKENKAGHIPYRDSKLTRLLKDSLGGNCRTVMIAAVSPSGLSYEDTYNTLKYADRAMNITCKVVKNELSVDMHVSRYAKIVEELRIEISELKKKLFGYESGPANMPKKSAGSSAQTEEIQRLSSSLRSVMKERMVVRRNIIDIEAAERDLQVKLYRKERSLKRVQFVCVEGEKLEQALSKTQLCTSNTKTKQKYLASKKTDFEEQIAKNNKWMERIQSEMQLLETDLDAKAQLEQCQTVVQLQLENMELRRNCQLYKRHVHAQEKDAQNTERLVEKLLGMVQKQFFLLKGVGLATQELTEEYDNVIETVESGREVTWADQSTKDQSSSDKSTFISFQATSIGTPLLRTPIRKRQFNTPVANSDMIPCMSTTRSKQVNRAFTHSATTEDPVFANPCISLTKEFEAMSSPAKVSRSLQEQCKQQKPVIPRETTSAQQNRNMATPLRVPSSFKAPDNNNFSSPAMFHCQNNLNEQSKCFPRKSTPHPKVCWTDTPVKGELSPPQKTQNTLRNATPMRESIDFNLSGIQVLGESPTDKDQHKNSSDQLRPPPSRDPLSTPLRELPVNKQNVLKDQLPSVLSQSKLFDKDKSNSHKKSKDMMPKRVCSATKENVQSLQVPSRSASVLGLDKLHSKKVKKHVNGLRRAMSNNSIGTSRNFAPRTSAIYQNLPKTKI